MSRDQDRSIVPCVMPFTFDGRYVMVSPEQFDRIRDSGCFRDGPHESPGLSDHAIHRWGHLWRDPELQGLSGKDVETWEFTPAVETDRPTGAERGAILKQDRSKVPGWMPFLLEDTYALVSPEQFDDWEAANCFRAGPIHSVENDMAGSMIHRWGQLWGGPGLPPYGGQYVETWEYAPAVEPEKTEPYPGSLADYHPVSKSDFDYLLSRGGGLSSGPFSHATVKNGLVEVTHWGTWANGNKIKCVLVNVVEESDAKVNQDPHDVNEWDDIETEEEVMPVPIIREKKRTLTLANIGPEEPFRPMDHPNTVMIRVASRDSVVKPVAYANECIPCVVLIDVRRHGQGTNVGIPYAVGMIQWMLPSVRVERLSLTECPEYEVID